jgi:tryptophanyl-tRNA synthetase
MFTAGRIEEIERECRGAGIGCTDCKKMLAESVVEFFAPFRERRADLLARPDYVRDVISDGAVRASSVARQTITEVKSAMHLLP